jgi:hypothetical protein
MYYSIEQLQQDLDVWMNKYNSERTHTGKYCNGKNNNHRLIALFINDL